MNDSDDTDDDIIAESSSPLPVNALYPGSPPIELGFRYHRPKYDTVHIGRGEPLPDPDPYEGVLYHREPMYDSLVDCRDDDARRALVDESGYLDPDDIPDDSRNPERLAARNEQLEQAHERFSAMVDRHVDALTPRERKILETRFEKDADILARIRKKNGS